MWIYTYLLWFILYPQYLIYHYKSIGAARIEYVLENNNVIQSNFNTIDSQGNPQVRTLNFTFDDKNTPMKNVVGYDKVAIDLSQYGIKNNFINYTASYTGSSNVGTYNIAYIYDENDFPASSVFTSSFNNYTENQFFYE